MENILFYTYPSCTSCRKTKKWLQQNGLSFTERHIFKQTPTHEELYKLLSMTTDGVDEILATRSQSFKDLNINVDELSLSQVVDLMLDNPKLLRRPIIIQDDQLIIGYKIEEFANITRNRKLFKAV